MRELLKLIGRAFIDTWIALAEGKHTPLHSRQVLFDSVWPTLPQARWAKVRLGGGEARQRAEQAAAQLAAGLTDELQQALRRYLSTVAVALRPLSSSARRGREEVQRALPDPLDEFPPVRWARITNDGQVYPTINETD